MQNGKILTPSCADKLIIHTMQQILGQLRHHFDRFSGKQFVVCCILGVELVRTAFIASQQKVHPFKRFILLQFPFQSDVCIKECTICHAKKLAAGIKRIHTFHGKLEIALRVVYDDAAILVFPALQRFVAQLPVIIDDVQPLVLAELLRELRHKRFVYMIKLERNTELFAHIRN